MQERRNINLLELVIILVVVIGGGAIVLPMMGGGCRGVDYYSYRSSGLYRCVKCYSPAPNLLYVDLRKGDDSPIETFRCEHNVRAGIIDPNTLFTKFEPDRWYEVEYVGHRKESGVVLPGYYPIIASVREIPKGTELTFEGEHKEVKDSYPVTTEFSGSGTLK